MVSSLGLSKSNFKLSVKIHFTVYQGPESVPEIHVLDPGKEDHGLKDKFNRGKFCGFVICLIRSICPKIHLLTSVMFSHLTFWVTTKV